MPRRIGEGGQLYFTAGLVKFLGMPLDYNAIKATTAVAGMLAVGATYLLLREVFSDRLVAVVGALFMAVAHWPVTVSRLALTMGSAPLWAALVLLFLIRALKYNRTNDFLLCGLSAGLGLYFYQGFRAVPFLIAACLGVKILIALLRRDWKGGLGIVGRGLLLGTMLVIVFAPMARAWHDDPTYYMAAVRSRATGEGMDTEYNVLGRFARNVQNAFYMFNWRGDGNNQNNIPGRIALDQGMAAMLLVGAALAISAWLRSRRNLLPYLLLVFLAFLLPSALALAFPGENPSFGRTAGVIPLAFGFIALPVAFVLSTLWRAFSRRLGPAVASLALVGLMIPLAVSNYSWYFHDYSASYDSLSYPTSAVAEAVQEGMKNNRAIQTVFVIGYPGWLDPRGVRVELGEPDWLKGVYPLPDSPPRGALYVLAPDDIESRQRLEAIYPDGHLQWHFGRWGEGDAFLLFTPTPSP
jgi:hypothetical protein